MVCQSVLPQNKVFGFPSVAEINSKMSPKSLLIKTEVAVKKMVGSKTYCTMLLVFLQGPK